MPAQKDVNDWVSAAFRLLEKKGIAAVRVEPLARALRVTKGSFYWHFTDRRALHKAMLERWEQVSTDEIMQAVEHDAADARSRLFRLMERAAGHPTAAGTEQAIRSWAAVDARARNVLERVDGRRKDYVSAMFRELGLSRKLADARSLALYRALIGEFTAVATGSPATEHFVWRDLLTQLLK